MSKIAIVDLDSVAYSAFTPNKVLDKFGIPLKENNKFVYTEKTEEEIIASVDSCMNFVLSNSGCTHYIGYIKGKGNYRYDIDSNYKGNRSKEEPKHWNLVKSLFISKWNAVEVNSIEVDDAVHITYRNLDNSFICAIDNDLLKLETKEGFPHYNWRKKEFFTITKEEAELKFWSDMITGQSGDGIKGLKGKGKVFAEKLLVDSYKFFNTKVMQSYIDVYKDNYAAEEFNKNYGLLKILDSYEGFIIPETTEYKKEEDLNIFNL